MPSQAYQNSKELLNFINDDHIPLLDFLFGGGLPQIPPIASNLTSDELKHERCHALVWSYMGIKSTFHKDAGGYPSTSPDREQLKSYIEETGMTKSDFLDFFKKVVNAPQDLEGIRLIGTDLRDFKILSGEIKTRDELATYVFSTNIA